jgi:hypothetical protein
MIPFIRSRKSEGENLKASRAGLSERAVNRRARLDLFRLEMIFYDESRQKQAGAWRVIKI